MAIKIILTVLCMLAAALVVWASEVMDPDESDDDYCKDMDAA